MPRDFEHSDRIKNVALGLIRIHHLHLVTAKIAYIMKLTDPDKESPAAIPKRMGKHPAMAKARVQGPLQKVLSGYDFVLEVDEDWWDTLSLEGQIALVDHELCHMARDVDGYYLKDHDVEEFIAVVKRYGLWRDNLKAMAGEMQLKFSFTEPEKSEDQPPAVQ